MKSILIVKFGAIGDMIRTTPILRRIKGRITWLTYPEGMAFLQGNPFINQLVSFKDYRKLLNSRFDWVINLEEDWRARVVCELVRAKKKSFWCREWCEMSIDDEVKKRNKRSYQYYMFKSLGLKFRGEGYVLNVEPKAVKDDVIGIEGRASDTWRLKRWDKYSELASLLRKNGFKVKLFKYRDNINDFLEDVNDCKIIVSGDTLAMHLGLGLRKKVVAIFGPTSSSEIYSYGRMKKVVAPSVCQCCYKRRCDRVPSCMHLISVKDVFEAVLAVNKR